MPPSRALLWISCFPPTSSLLKLGGKAGLGVRSTYFLPPYPAKTTAAPSCKAGEVGASHIPTKPVGKWVGSTYRQRRYGNRHGRQEKGALHEVHLLLASHEAYQRFYIFILNFSHVKIIYFIIQFF